MSRINKTEALILKRQDYGDASRIISFYTKDFGKLTGILKGAKSSKSRIGKGADIFNLLQIVFYKNETREVQLISNVEPIEYFDKIKDDLNKFKYAAAVLEALGDLTPENEASERLFRGSTKILRLINDGKENPRLLLLKYLLFLLKEIGFELQILKCAVCGKEFEKFSVPAFNFEKGTICKECENLVLTSFSFSPELFELLFCLIIHKKNNDYPDEVYDALLSFIEKYIKRHNNHFKGLKSLNIY